MNDSKRATVHFEPDVYRALRLKAATSEQSISEIVNNAVKVVLGEDADDLAVFAQKEGERSLSFDTFAHGLRRRGRI